VFVLIEIVVAATVEPLLFKLFVDLPYFSLKVVVDFVGVSVLIVGFFVESSSSSVVALLNKNIY
jgi:hypothetical protein